MIHKKREMLAAFPDKSQNTKLYCDSSLAGKITFI